MYISESIKELLRPYVGQSVQVDARIVVQPINPGDARIDELDVLGPTESKYADYSNLRLTIEPNFQPGEYPAFEVEITNVGTEIANPTLSRLAPTVLIRRDQISHSLLPGDGPSHAVITRHVLESIQTHEWTQIGMSRRDADGVPTLHYFKWMVEDFPPDFKRFSLKPGEGRKVQLLFDLPPGEYDLLVSLALFGLPFYSHGLASNLTAFDVLDDGTGLPIEIDR